MAGFPEDSDGPPFVFWKDHFGCDVEDAQWWGQDEGQKTKYMVNGNQQMGNKSLE